MKKIRSNLILALILLLAALLRGYKMSYPPLNADEAAIGYNAWSLSLTGRDEHGESWPLHFKSFGDYKPGLYFYMVLPLVKILGLNELAVRLPSFIAGVLTVYLVYRLALRLWKDKNIALLWAAMLAISPWHIHFSRGGWESNVALFFLVTGTYFFFISLPELKFRSLFSAILCYILAMYTYHSARIVAPFLFLGLVAANRIPIWQKKRQILLPTIFGFILLAPLILSFFKGGASARFSGVGLIADPGPLWRANELRSQHEQPQSALPTILHNRYFSYATRLVENYFSHFDGKFLFIAGDEVPRSKLPDMGLMYLPELLLLPLGVIYWLRKKQVFWYVPFLWLAVSPLASSLTFQAPSALRALPLTIPLTFFVSCGILFLWELKLRDFFDRYWQGAVLIILSLSYFWSLAYWQDQYFVHYLKRFPEAWPIGFKEATVWLKENQSRYPKIKIVTSHDQPYILTLFYLHYPPQQIQKEIRLTPPDKYGFSTVASFGKYVFGRQAAENDKIIKDYPLIKIYETD